MTVISYFDETGVKIPDRACNEVMRDQIIAAGGTPVRSTAAQMLEQDSFSLLLEQALGIAVGGPGNGWASNARAVVGAAAIAVADDGFYISQDVTAAPAAATLPSAAALRAGFCFALQKIDASANAITLTPNGADTVTGPTTLSSQFDALLVVRTGAATWQTVAVSRWPAFFNGADDGTNIAVAPPAQATARNVLLSAGADDTDGNGGAIGINGAAAVGTNRTGGPATVSGGAGIGSGAGGSVSIGGAIGGATGAGGAVSIVGGAGGATSGAGGAIAITAGAAGPTGNGGAAVMTGGASTAGFGGAAQVKGGSTAGATNAGAAFLTGGNSGSAFGGACNIAGGAALAGSNRGGNVVIDGGPGTGGTADGGNVNINGGSSAGGNLGSVNVGTSTNTLAVNICAAAGTLGFFGLATAVVKQTITGAKADAVATSILNALVAYGMVTDGTT